jgi:WD40 repeat protein
MNSSNIFNIRKKSTLITLVSFLPKRRKLELIRENKRLQKALGVKEVLYQIYNIKKSEEKLDYDLTDYLKDEYTKREILKSLFEICNLPFFNNIGFNLNISNQENISTQNNQKMNICHSKIINNIVRLPPMIEGQILIGSYSWDNTFKIWDIQTNTLLHNLRLPLEDIICGVIPLYDMKKYQDRRQPILLTIVTWDKSIITYNLRDNSIYLNKNIDLFGKIMCILRFNNYLLTSSYESEINVWNINDLINKQKDIDLNVNINPKKVFVFKGHKGPIPKIISYDNKRILSCGWDESIKMWNLEKFVCEDSINKIGDKLINMNLLKDKITLGVVINYGDVKLINLKTKEVIMQFEGTYFIYELNDHRLITVLHEIELEIMNLNTKKVELIYKTSHKSKISGLIQLEDGRIITCSYDQTIKIHGFVSKREKSNDAEDFIYSYWDDCLYITHKSKDKS